MKLDDFLKFKKVRYINLDGKGLTNKEYELLGVTDRSCIINDNGCEIWVDINNCKPVLDSAENPLQNIEITPKFKVGDKVYTGLTGDIKTIDEIVNEYPPIYKVVSKQGYTPRLKQEAIALATQENYERLRATFPDIEFEVPPKELKGSDLARALGVGYMFGFDMQSALAEVVRSNWSKFENGKPVFDDNGKIKKGANYTPPQLHEFI